MNLLASERGRRVLFAALYVSEGAPIGFIWWALPPKLRLAGVPVPEVTALTAALALPWTFKFLWAPLVDRLRLPRVGFRLWIAGAQLCMGLTLLGLIGLDPLEQMSLVAPLLMLHALAAATQDAAVDGLAIAVVNPRERGRLQGFTQTGMLAGRATFGGGALLLERWVGPDAVLLGLIAVIWSSLVLLALTLRTDEPSFEANGESAGARALISALTTRTSLLGLGFALIGGVGFEAVGALAGTLLVDRGVAQETLGTFFAGPSVAAMVLGAIAGGRVADRLPRVRAASLGLFLSFASVLCLAACDFMNLGPSALLGSLTLCYLVIGFFVATSYALFMDLTDVRFGATHFSAYMGATNGCEVLAGFGSGRLQPVLGYPGAFLALGCASLLALPLLRALSSRTEDRRREPSPRRSPP